MCWSSNIWSTLLRLSQVCPMSCMIGELSCGDLNTRTVSCTCVHWCVTCTCVHVWPVHYQDTLYNTTVTQYPRTRDHHSVIPISTISLLTLLDTHSSIIQVISLYIYIYIFIFKWGWRKTNIHEDFYDLNCRLRWFLLPPIISIVEYKDQESFIGEEISILRVLTWCVMNELILVLFPQYIVGSYWAEQRQLFVSSISRDQLSSASDSILGVIRQNSYSDLWFQLWGSFQLKFN